MSLKDALPISFSPDVTSALGLPSSGSVNLRELTASTPYCYWSGLAAPVSNKADSLQNYIYSFSVTLFSPPGTNFYKAVTVSGDGSTMAALASGSTGNTVVIFNRSGNTWIQSASFQWPSNDPSGSPSTTFGFPLALNADGTHLAISDLSGEAIWVYTYNGTSWSSNTPLVAGTPTPPMFGNRLAISADGNTVATAWSDANNPTNIYVLVATFSGGALNFVTNINVSSFLGASTTDPAEFSVAISSDGNTIAAGLNYGPAYPVSGVGIFRKTGSTWASFSSTFIGGALPAAETDGLNLIGFGSSVSLNADGTKVLIGADQSTDSSGTIIGQAFTFTSPNSTSLSWTFEQSFLPPGPYTYNTTYGYGVAIGACVRLSKDGNVAAILAGNTYANTPTIWVYSKSGGSWSLKTTISPPVTMTYGDEGASGGDFIINMFDMSMDGKILAYLPANGGVPGSTPVTTAVQLYY